MLVSFDVIQNEHDLAELYRLKHDLEDLLHYERDKVKRSYIDYLILAIDGKLYISRR